MPPSIRIVIIFLCFIAYLPSSFSQIKNFGSAGRQVTRFSTTGDAIDAHDGENFTTDSNQTLKFETFIK